MHYTQALCALGLVHIYQANLLWLCYSLYILHH